MSLQVIEFEGVQYAYKYPSADRCDVPARESAQ